MLNPRNLQSPPRGNSGLIISYGFVAMLVVSVVGCGAIHNTMMLDVNGIQFGIASWYGNKFHGRMTKSGEEYDMNEFTAAHRSLPFGTIVKVTNIKNGRSAIVRINDRGPRKTNRVIDLSYAAAAKIGMLEDGIAKVRLDVIDEQDEASLQDRIIQQDWKAEVGGIYGFKSIMSPGHATLSALVLGQQGRNPSILQLTMQ